MKTKSYLISSLVLFISLILINPQQIQASPSQSAVNTQWISETAAEAPKSYEMIRTALLNGHSSGQFNTNELSYSVVGEFIKKIINETPEIMYYNGAKFWSNGKIEFNYSVPNATVLAHQKQLQKEVKKVLQTIIKPKATDFDKVKSIHDYIVLNTAYNYEHYINNSIPKDSYTAFGSLINGIAVCDGYTKAAQILLNEMGFENYYVFGNSNGDDHSWNLLKLDGEFYFMDITWDDPVPNKPGAVGYSYFLITSNQLKKDHNWNQKNWPTATSEKYKYFNDFGSMIESKGSYYYSSLSKDLAFYKIAKDGSKKQKINSSRVYSFILKDDQVYFSNYSNGGYLYKMKKDGSNLKQINSIHSTDLVLANNTLTYLNQKTKKHEKINLR